MRLETDAVALLYKPRFPDPKAEEVLSDGDGTLPPRKKF